MLTRKMAPIRRADIPPHLYSLVELKLSSDIRWSKLFDVKGSLA